METYLQPLQSNSEHVVIFLYIRMGDIVKNGITLGQFTTNYCICYNFCNRKWQIL